MAKFKYENCTSKHFIRKEGWIPEGLERKKRVGAKKRGPGANRRLRYLTFCAEGALDVLMLRDAKIIKRSSDGLYDTVCFFDFAPQAVDKTLDIIEGANGFPVDFFDLMNVDDSDIEDGVEEVIPVDVEESDETFTKQKDAALYRIFRESFPFDLINLDVERYLLRPSEELPGKLIKAWDKILDWQKRGRLHENKNYSVDQFTLFFTTKIGPTNLPEPHRSNLIELIDENVSLNPDLGELMKTRFDVEDGGTLYEQDFDEFLKLAVPKALLTRAINADWILDTDMTYRLFEFAREPENSPNYTMLHFILHFRRCVPSLQNRLNPTVLPLAVKADYTDAVATIFSTTCDDVDNLKLPSENALKAELAKYGVAVE